MGVAPNITTMGKIVVDQERKCPMCGHTTWVLLDGLGLRGRGSLGVRQHPQLDLPAPIGGSGSWASRPRSRLSGVVVASAAPQPLQKAAPTGFSRPQLVQMSTR